MEDGKEGCFIQLIICNGSKMKVTIIAPGLFRDSRQQAVSFVEMLLAEVSPSTLFSTRQADGSVRIVGQTQASPIEILVEGENCIVKEEEAIGGSYVRVGDLDLMVQNSGVGLSLTAMPIPIPVNA